jgi:malate/lactate dehydrogenase
MHCLEGIKTVPSKCPEVHLRHSLCFRLQGEDKIYECTFVEADIVADCKYFATKCRLGKEGVVEVLPLPELSPFETKKMEEVRKELQKNIEKGEKFVTN